MPSREAQTSQIDEGAPTSASSKTRAKRSDASEQASSQTSAPSRRKSSVPSRSKAAQDESATEQLQPQVHADPAYPLTRVQKIVKMENEQAQISREAAFILALAAEELTKQLAQAGIAEMNAAGRKELALSDLATRVASKDDWTFLREMIPVSIPLSAARGKRAQKETVAAVSPSSSTQQLSAQERLKIKVKRPVAPLPSRSSNGATSVIPPHLHVPNPQPTYSLREARAASMQHVPQQQPHPHPMPGFPNGVPYYPAPLVSPTGPQSATPDSAYPNGVRWAPGPPPSIAAQSPSSPQPGGRRSSRQQARQTASSSKAESQGDPQLQNQAQPSGYNPAVDPMMHPYMHPPPGFYYSSPPGYAMPPPGMFVAHPGFPSHPSTPVPPAPGKSVTEKPGPAGGGTGSNTQPAPGNDSHIIDPSLME